MHNSKSALTHGPEPPAFPGPALSPGLGYPLALQSHSNSSKHR